MASRVYILAVFLVASVAWLAGQQTRLPSRQIMYEFGTGLTAETDPSTGITRVSVAPVPLPSAVDVICAAGVLSCRIIETPVISPSPYRAARIEVYRNGLYQSHGVDYRWETGALEFTFISRPVMAGEIISVVVYYH